MLDMPAALRVIVTVAPPTSHGAAAALPKLVPVVQLALAACAVVVKEVRVVGINTALSELSSLAAPSDVKAKLAAEMTAPEGIEEVSIVISISVCCLKPELTLVSKKASLVLQLAATKL